MLLGEKFFHFIECAFGLDKSLIHFRLEIEGKFVSGVQVDAGGEICKFIPGQLVGLADADDQLRFVAGQLDDKNSFVPGLSANGIFFPGIYIYNENHW